MLYLTPSAIGYLTQVILAVLISGYMLWRAWRPRSPLHARLLSGFWVALTAFLTSLLAEAALPATPHLCVVLLQTPLLCLAWMCLLRFACHFPHPLSAPRRVTNIVLSLSGLYTLWEWGYAAFRFVRLGVGVVEYRPDWSDWLLLLFLSGPVMVFLQQMYRHTPASGRLAARVAAPWRCPPTHQVHTLRSFSLIFMGVAALGLFSILRTFYLLSTALANLGIGIGILIALFAFALTYLNQQSETISFTIRLSGATLVVMLSILGLVGWIVAPPHITTYRPALKSALALRFTPDANGYRIAEIPFEFDPDLGRDLGLDDGRLRGCSEPLDMVFPFYGQTYWQVYVCNDGTISLGQVVRYREYQYHYGAGVPLLLPLLIDLDPTISPGGVFVRQDAGRLIVTWNRLRAFRQPQAEFTFQAVLHTDGRFDFVYAALSQDIPFLPNDDPGASLWAVGALPGRLGGPGPAMFSLAHLPTRGDAQGMIYDMHLEFRQYLHRLMAPLAGLVLAVSILIVGGFPLLFYINLMRPLNTLLDGVRQMEAGRLESRVPVQFEDEIGSLTRSFNTLAAALSDLIYNLGERVAERTAELNTANADLRAEIAAREQAHATIIVQQRALAALEERARLGRDLHDGIGQVLGYINVQTQAARTLFAQGKNAAGDALLARLVGLAQQGHAEVREFILGMRRDDDEQASRPPSLDFLAALRQYVAQCEHWYGQPVILDLPPVWDAAWLSQTAEIHLLRLVQEALTNALRHAQAGQVQVCLAQQDSELILTVMDNGIGFEADRESGIEDKAGHFGLAIMRERAVQVGGQIEIASSSGQGTRIVLRMPIVSGDARPGDASSLRVLLVDDQPIFVEGLRNLLQAQGVQVVGVAQDGLEAHEQVHQTQPDVVVMDLDMPRCDGLEATRRILAEFPQTRILILTVSADANSLFEALKAGAAGYLLKNMDADAFIDILFNLERSAPPIAPELAARVRNEFAQPPSEALTVDAELTAQQQQVLSLVAQGLTYRQVGQAMYLSETTIKYHMKQILDRLHLRSRQQAVAYARRGGIAPRE